MFDIRKLGARIASNRKAFNMTQVELADRMGVSYQAVSNWERGNSAPDISKLPELAEIFNQSVDQLLGEEQPLVAHLINGTAREYLNENPAPAEELMHIAPVLKPTQYEQVFENADISVTTEELCGLAPFLSREPLTA